MLHKPGALQLRNAGAEKSMIAAGSVSSAAKTAARWMRTLEGLALPKLGHLHTSHPPPCHRRIVALAIESHRDCAVPATENFAIIYPAQRARSFGACDSQLAPPCARRLIHIMANMGRSGFRSDVYGDKPRGTK